MGRPKLIEDDELLRRARAIFVKEGVGVSSRKLATEMGVSNAVLFQRFGSKQELLLAALAPPAPELQSLLEAAESSDTLAHLEQILCGLLEYFRKLVPVMQPLMSHRAFRELFQRRHPNSPLEKLLLDLMLVLEGKRERGEIHCDDAGTVGFNLVAIAFSWASFEWLGVHEGQPFSRELIRAQAQMIWRGIAPGR